MHPSVAFFLTEHYRPSVQRLQAMLGRDMGWAGFEHLVPTLPQQSKPIDISVDASGGGPLVTSPPIPLPSQQPPTAGSLVTKAGSATTEESEGRDGALLEEEDGAGEDPAVEPIRMALGALKPLVMRRVRSASSGVNDDAVAASDQTSRKPPSALKRLHHQTTRAPGSIDGSKVRTQTLLSRDATTALNEPRKDGGGQGGGCFGTSAVEEEDIDAAAIEPSPDFSWLKVASVT